jgi:hypothetical protein
MNRYGRVSVGLILVLLALALSACAPGESTPEPIIEVETLVGGESVPEVGDGGSPVGSVVSTHLCNHPYFPALDGANWRYSGVESAAGPYSFTDTVINVRADGFTLSGEFDGLVRTQEWSCSEAGVSVLDYGGMNSARVTTSGMDFQLQTTEMSGVTLPADLAPGSSWSQSFTVAGEMVMEGAATSTATGTAVSHNVAIEFETVTVPAGTFEALRIERTIEIDLLIHVGGASLPTTVSSTESTWFARGVGWIKSSFTGMILDQPIDESIVLDAYSIP